MQQNRPDVTQASGEGSESEGDDKTEPFALRVLLDDGGTQSGTKRDAFSDPTSKTLILTAIIFGVLFALVILLTIYMKEKK